MVFSTKKAKLSHIIYDHIAAKLNYFQSLIILKSFIHLISEFDILSFICVTSI